MSVCSCGLNEFGILFPLSQIEEDEEEDDEPKTKTITGRYRQNVLC